MPAAMRAPGGRWCVAATNCCPRRCPTRLRASDGPPEALKSQTLPTPDGLPIKQPPGWHLEERPSALLPPRSPNAFSASANPIWYRHKHGVKALHADQMPQTPGGVKECPG